MSILLVTTVVRVYCCTQKMLKEIEMEETIGLDFFVTLLSLVAFQLGEHLPLATPMPMILPCPMYISLQLVNSKS